MAAAQEGEREGGAHCAPTNRLSIARVGKEAQIEQKERKGKKGEATSHIVRHDAICCHAPSTVSFHMVAALLASLTHRMLPATDHDRRQAGVLKSCSVV